MTGRLVEKNGKYQAVLYFRDKNKKEKQIWRSTGYEIKGNKKKAEIRLEELKEEFKHLEYNEEKAKKNNRLFIQAVQQWLKSKENIIDCSTYEGYTNYVYRHIVPYFEPLNLNIEDVTPRHIKDYYEHKYKDGGRADGKPGGLSVRSIKKHSIVLKQVFKEAFIAEQIIRNPTIGVPFPKNEKPEFKGSFLTGEEANHLLHVFAGHPLQTMVYVTLYYGLRRSEVLGLRWSSVDFEENTIKIENTVVQVLTLQYKNTTKSKASTHTFPMLDEVREVLLKLKEQQIENRKIFGGTYQESDYVFKWPDGKLYRPEYITRSFKKVLKKHNLKMIRFHDLRHSTASILYDKGWELKDLQEWLRHAQVETTGNIYTHISNSRKQATAKSLEKTFKI